MTQAKIYPYGFVGKRTKNKPRFLDRAGALLNIYPPHDDNDEKMKGKSGLDYPLGSSHVATLFSRFFRRNLSILCLCGCGSCSLILSWFLLS
jgi:hypothetical protein